MRSVFALAGIAVVASSLGACATAMHVGSHVEPGLDIARYRTFAWGTPDALPKSDARLDGNPSFHDYMQGAVEKGLARRGLAMAAADGADLLVHYHSSVTTRIDVNRDDRAAGYCTQGDCPPDTVEYEAGTIVLDVIDARSGRLVWRGWAQLNADALLKPAGRLGETTQRAVDRMLRELPAGR